MLTEITNSSAKRGDHTYRLRGNTRNFDLVTINVYGMLGHTPVSDIRTVSSIASEEFATDDNGDLSRFLCAAPTEGDWLKLEPDAYIVVIRRLVSDWDKTDEGLWKVLNLTLSIARQSKCHSSTPSPIIRSWFTAPNLSQPRRTSPGLCGQSLTKPNCQIRIAIDGTETRKRSANDGKWFPLRRVTEARAISR